jgi:hypothetical protein
VTTTVTETTRRIVESPFGDALSQGIDWIVISLAFVLLLEHEFVRLSSRDESWKRSRMTWLYAGPLLIGFVSIVVQRLSNLR